MDARIERIKALISYFGMNTTTFAKQIGFNQSNLSKILRGEREIPANLTEKILDNFKVKRTWLMTGDGEMLKGDTKENSIRFEGAKGMLPEVSFVFAAGQTHLINGNENINRYWYLPDSTDCDAVVPIEGESMAPNIPPGSYAVIKRFNITHQNPNSIPFGQVFGVVVEDESTGEYHGYIKVLRRYKDPEMAKHYWIAHSFNPDYDDFDIHLSQVRALWIVKQHIVSNISY